MWLASFLIQGVVFFGVQHVVSHDYTAFSHKRYYKIKIFDDILLVRVDQYKVKKNP